MDQEELGKGTSLRARRCFGRSKGFTAERRRAGRGVDQEVDHERSRPNQTKAFSDCSHPIRSHVFGYILVNSSLCVYLLTTSALFFTPSIVCDSVNHHLTLFLLRLSRLSDHDLGVLATSTTPFASAKASIPSTFLPRPLSVTSQNKYNIIFLDLVAKRFTATGRCTSTFRVSCRDSSSNTIVENAMSVVFAEASRIKEHDAVRKLILEADLVDAVGLCRTVDVYRGDYKVGVEFIPGREPKIIVAAGFHIVDRALEVTFYEESINQFMRLDPLWN